MSDARDTIKDFIASGKRFFIACDPSLDEAALFAASALQKILELAGKDVFFWPPITAELAAKYAPLLHANPNPPIPRKIKIKIPKSVALEEMRYEDEPDAISIIISPKTHLDIKDLLIERVPYEMDAAFCFFDDEATLEKIEAPILRPSREKTIFLVRNSRTLAEKISDISESVLGASIAEPATTTLLFASLLAETDHLRSARSASTFHLAGSLVERGANIEHARAAITRAPAIGAGNGGNDSAPRRAPDESGFSTRPLVQTPQPSPDLHDPSVVITNIRG